MCRSLVRFQDLKTALREAVMYILYVIIMQTDDDVSLFIIIVMKEEEAGQHTS